MSWLVEIYDGTQHPAVHPHTSEEFRSLRDARAFAARGLGHASLRGASTWNRYQGGTVFQFGPRVEDNGYDFAVISELGETPHPAHRFGRGR